MTKKEKNPKGPADAEAHAEDGANVEPEATEEPVTQFKAKLNKYGFVHISKKALPSLPFKIEQPLEARIDGDHLIIAATTEKKD